MQRLAGHDIGVPVPEPPGGEGRENRERLATTRALLASPVSGGQLSGSGKAGLYGGFMPADDHVRAGGTAARDLDIVDAHAHLINLEALDYPWIRHRSAVLEALLDNYYDAAHDYGVGRYRSDTAGERPARWVACEFGAADPVAEAEWIQRCSQSQGAPHAFIAAVDLTSPSLGEVLARYRDLPVVHAVRQPLYWAEDRLRRLGAQPDYLTDRPGGAGSSALPSRGSPGICCCTTSSSRRRTS
jgi:hypothetical protein